jgi:hypothetical protein
MEVIIMNAFTKVIRQGAPFKLLNQCNWVIEETVVFDTLEISPRAVVTAPEGKIVTLIHNGVVRDMKPGKYQGRVVLYVSEPYAAVPEGLMALNQITTSMAPAVCVENGAVNAAKSISEAVISGTVTDTEADGLYLAADCEQFNGIVINHSKYTVKNARMDMEGFGPNDFAGVCSGIAALGTSEVEIEDSEFNLSGTTRCAIHVSGDSRVHVKNCDITNIAPNTDWLGSFSWQIALMGANRLCQLAGNGQVIYENCRLKSNGWGLCSIDGSDEFVSLTVKDSHLTLTGPNSHGYGAFCIGPNEVILDHSVVDVYGYPMLVMGMEGKGRTVIRNGCTLTGRRFGALIFSDDNSVVDISDTAFDTGRANLVVKGSSTIINLDRCTMQAGDGVLLQLMDSDECGMDTCDFKIPVDEVDVPVEGRDLTIVSPEFDVTMNLSNMTVTGDLYNSTTNIRAYQRSEKGGMGTFHDTLVGTVDFAALAEDTSGPSGHTPDELRGPKNLGVNLTATSLTGQISSATQSYREGLTVITANNRLEMSNITQQAAPTVNNGVVVSLDKDSAWMVTDTSYLTSLTLAEGAQVLAAEGKSLTMTVDGVPTPVAAGSYTGKIVLTVC